MGGITESNSGLLSPLLVATRPADELGIDVDALSRFIDATGPLAVVDLETTGLSDDPAAEILEFGAVLIDPGARSITTVESLLRPRLPLPLTISHLTGLTDADVMTAPTIDEISKRIELVLDGRTLIAHNADFERSFLTRFVSTALSEYRYLDTQDFLAMSHPDSADLRLETFTRAMLHREERHRALSDALDTVRVMSAAAVGVAAGERRYAVARNALESYAPESPWLPLFCGGAQLAAEDPNSQFAEVLPGSEKPVPFDENAIVAVLSDADRGRR
jgi:DNA polymerase III epsilon subunit-like protein